jgi:hypothetical protein
MASLERSLYRVVVEVAAPVAGLVVNLDGQPLAPGAWGTPIPVDPGPRRLVASAPGRRPFEQSLAVPDHAGQETLRVPPLELLPAPAPAAAVAVQRQVLSPAKGRRIAGWSLVGTGVAGVAAGSVLGLAAKHDLDQSRPLCPRNLCDSAGLSLNQQARRAATASTVAFAVGVAAAAAGAFLLYLWRAR